MNLWDEWGIQALVIGSLSFQVILTLFGSNRIHVTRLIGLCIRSVLRGTYLVATEVVPYSLGKLTGLRIDNPLYPDLGVKLKALLALLLLLQLSYLDNLTTYSIEDNRLGLRQVLKRSIVVMVIVGILIRCWNYTAFIILYFPKLLASIINYVSNDQLSIDNYSHQEAFRIVEIELGLMYDMLYTSACNLHKVGLVHPLGITLGAFSALEKSINPLAEIMYGCMFMYTY
ncbi:hypothetical protein EUGRSUZ_C00237 [Eucalyptus grandis]|uniref:Uncharacterized protein n=2 Tax=Eucalyptus grandis TaxID=71139 RepID=A0ACC3L9U2_EUCGR|nr:hypothetical protein EUGRSUZ_C00237 [Eucalyptus grandis]